MSVTIILLSLQFSFFIVFLLVLIFIHERIKKIAKTTMDTVSNSRIIMIIIIKVNNTKKEREKKEKRK